MAIESDPVIDDWYQDRNRLERFTVVAFDQDDGLLELQYENGDLEEIDLDAWYEMDIESVAMPEDWTLALDNMDEQEAAEMEQESYDDWDEEIMDTSDSELQDRDEEED